MSQRHAGATTSLQPDHQPPGLARAGGLDVMAALEETYAVLHEDDDTAQRILAVADALVLARGTAGLQVAELARAAGVSRPTVYRRWESSEAIVETLFVRHVVACVEAIGGPVAETRAEITTKLTDFSDAFFADPVLTHLAEHEPVIFSRYLFQQVSAVQVIIIGWIAAAVEAAQAHGSVRPGDPHRTAVMLLLVMQSTLLAHHSVVRLIDPRQWKPELTLLLDGYLRP
jgi:AcrR family transcriptional regulator